MQVQESLEGIEDPKLRAFAQSCFDRIEKSAENILLTVIAQLLSEGDVLVLGIIGIDGRQKILDVLIEQCQKLKKEFENDH